MRRQVDQLTTPAPAGFAGAVRFIDQTSDRFGRAVQGHSRILNSQQELSGHYWSGLGFVVL